MINDKDFWFEFEMDKNLKYIVTFKNNNYEYTEKEFKIIQPKLKNKLKVETWIKPKNNNSLF